MIARIRTYTGIISIIFLLAFSACDSPEEAASGQPNFIFYITDDISFNDIGCYGNTVVKTPHINRLASEGLAFDNAYLTASSCSPTRCSIITGRYPHNTGAPELHTELPETQVMFPELLRGAGYYTVLAGKNHIGPVSERAFDTIASSRPGGQENWVELLAGRPEDKPFFCWFASHDAHRAWQMDSAFTVYDPASIEVPPMLYDGPKTRKDLANYYHEISRVDHYMGELRKELDRQGIAGNTYIIFCSDNGRPFPRSKVRLYDSGIKTHLIVYGPGVKQGRTNSLVSVIDIAPTIMELAGLDQHPGMQGVSMQEIFADHKAIVRDFTFSEHNWHVYQGHERMVRYGDWIYIRNWFPGRRVMSVESSPRFPSGEELWDAYEKGLTDDQQEDVFLVDRPAEELYHRARDPYQFDNLAGLEKYTETLSYLRRVLERWVEETGDHVPDPITRNRENLRNERLEDWKGYGQMAGAALGADTITRPGPVRRADPEL